MSLWRCDRVAPRLLHAREPQTVRPHLSIPVCTARAVCFGRKGGEDKGLKKGDAPASADTAKASVRVPPERAFRFTEDADTPYELALVPRNQPEIAKYVHCWSSEAQALYGA